jgi:hypothetical protein
MTKRKAAAKTAAKTAAKSATKTATKTRRPAAKAVAAAEKGGKAKGEKARTTQNKTQATEAGVGRFLESVEDDAVRVDCLALIEMMRQASGCEPVMWGSAIVGFGSYHYVYESGREGDFLIIGFSPRKRNIAVYLRGGIQAFPDELAQLGKHETGKGCLYLRNLGDVDTKVLKAILKKSYREGLRLSVPAAG